MVGGFFGLAHNPGRFDTFIRCEQKWGNLWECKFAFPLDIKLTQLQPFFQHVIQMVW
jgi:hypothetical protein